MQEFNHYTVMKNEAVDALNCQNGLIYVDATLGGGGHSELILQSIQPDGRLISFDIDDESTIKYLKCETLDVDTNTEGIHLVGTNEFPLGWAKIKKGRLKNKYSSSWRWL